MSTDTAPRYIAPETGYTGRHQRLGVPAGMRVSAFEAREIAEIAREGVIWEFCGHVHGAPLFTRSRYVADADGSLVEYSARGDRALRHPAGRVIKVLVR